MVISDAGPPDAPGTLPEHWLLTVSVGTDRHHHLDVIDPLWAAIVIGLLNDLTGSLRPTAVTRWSGEWHCPDCDAWRFEPGPLSLVNQGR